MSKIINAKLLLFIFIGTLFGLSGCSHLHPYHVPVQQGNILEAKTVQQVEIGMSKHEVTELLGSPVLRNSFDDNLWTYVYTSKTDGQQPLKQQLTLHFSGDRLVSMEKHI